MRISDWSSDVCSSDLLARPDVIHGQFIQEKHLRALPQPLTSKGRFVLAKNHGLLWLLQTPLQQDYRITSQGIARRDGDTWQTLPNKSAGADQTRLFLARSEGRRVGKEGVSTCNSRWSPNN